MRVAATQVARAIVSGRARGHSCVGMKIDFTASVISVTISKMKKKMKKVVDERKKEREQARAETYQILEMYMYWLRTTQTMHPARMPSTRARHAQITEHGGIYQWHTQGQRNGTLRAHTGRCTQSLPLVPSARHRDGSASRSAI